jgi:hypothetical protein
MLDDPDVLETFPKLKDLPRSEDVIFWQWDEDGNRY